MSDRKHLIRIAAALPAGNATRRVILTELQKRADDPLKWVPRNVKSRLPEFARILKDVPLETRALAGSVDPEDAYYDIIEMLDWGKGPRNEPVEKDKRTYNKLESLESDMWFEDYLDHVADSIEEDYGISEDDLRSKVQEELALQLIKAGILGKRAKRGALQKRAVWRWMSDSIDEVLKDRHDLEDVPPGTYASMFKSLNKRDRAKAARAAASGPWSRRITTWSKAMEPAVSAAHPEAVGSERHNAGELEMLAENLFDVGIENQLSSAQNRDWNDRDIKELFDEFFDVIAKL